MIKSFFKIWLPRLIIVVALVIIVLYIFRKVPIPPANPLEKTLQHQNDSLLKEVHHWKSEDSAKAAYIDTLMINTLLLDQQIKTSTTEHEKIIHYYDHATKRELEQFFSERYER